MTSNTSSLTPLLEADFQNLKFSYISRNLFIKEMYFYIKLFIYRYFIDKKSCCVC